MRRESLPLLASLPMLKGLRDRKVDDFNVFLYVNGELCTHLPTVLKGAYVVDLYLIKEYGDGGVNYFERIFIKEAKERKPDVERLEYSWRKSKDGQILEDLYLTLKKEGEVSLDSYRRPYGFSVRLKEDGEEALPTALLFDKDGRVPISKAFYKELLETVAGGLSVKELFNEAKNAKTTEEFVRIVRPNAERALRKMVDYVKEHYDVEWTRALSAFGRFYELPPKRGEELRLKSGYKIRFDGGIVLEVVGGDGEVLASWTVNRDGVRGSVGRKSERFNKIEDFLKRHYDGFLKDLLDYLEKRSEESRSIFPNHTYPSLTI